MLVLYSTEDRLEELDARKRGAGGDEAHRRAARRRGKRSRFPRALAG